MHARGYVYIAFPDDDTRQSIPLLPCGSSHVVGGIEHTVAVYILVYRRSFLRASTAANASRCMRAQAEAKAEIRQPHLVLRPDSILGARHATAYSYRK